MIKDLGAVSSSEFFTQTAMEINMAGASKHMLKVKGQLTVKREGDNLPYALSKRFSQKYLAFRVS